MFPLFCVLSVLFFLKIFYNLSVPYMLLYRQDEKAGISTMVYTEVLLLLLGVAVAYFVRDTHGSITPGVVAMTGIVLIIGSYVHFFLAMMIGGLLINRMRKKDD